MSLTSIRAALDARLEAFTPALSIAWENMAYKPAANAPFVKVDLLPARTENPSMMGADAGTDLRRMRGIYQLLLNYPNNAGPGGAAVKADALVAHFPRGLSLVYGGVTVRVFNTPSIAPHFNDGSWYVLPVSIEYQADLYS